MADTVRRAGDAVTSLGIDLGTGSVKVAAIDGDGRVAVRASRPYKVRAPRPGWAEGDPREWLSATRAVAESIVTGLHPLPTGVGLSGQMHGVVVADASMMPLRPAILWADTRAVDEARDLAQAFAPEELSRLGSPAVVGFAATTIAWLMRHEPEVMARAAYVLQPKDWLRAALGGEVATDPSDASGTLLYDVVDGAWSARMLDWLGLDPSLLPPVRSSIAPAGEVRIPGLARPVPCVVGAADTACALAGLGLRPGDGFVAVGTGAQVVRVMDEPVVDASLRTHTFATAGGVGSGWYLLGAVQSGGLVLSAALGWLGASTDEASAAMRKGVKPDDPVFVPYLAGERTPFMRPELRGSWHGISLSTDRPAMLRSVLEGVAQAVALGVEAVQESGQAMPEAVPLIGGGTHDPAFRHLLADATGLSLVVTDAPDSAVVGAGMLSEGVIANPRTVVGVETIGPNREAARILGERRARMVAYAQQDLQARDKSAPPKEQP